MGAPVRTVCVTCLHSLEIPSGDERNSRTVCPYCKSELDLRRSYLDDSTSEGFASPPPVDSAASTPKVRPKGWETPGRIGRFLLREPLGEGGYGEVYRAFDPQLERDVALKILKPNRLGEKALERFYREARAAARLDHPNIVGLHDAGRDEDRCWIAYQLVSGQTLSMLRDLDPPSVEAAVRIVRELALALAHAHGRGVYHRDLKPANVLIDDSGRARLTDFGLARRGDLESSLTQEGTVLGTPQYMSPEAAAGRAHEADGRSDLYSLGVILYELICGKRPSDFPSGAPLWRSTKVATPPTPRSVVRAIPVELDRICMKALAFDPESRYPDARSFADALTRFLKGRPNPRSGAEQSKRNAAAMVMIVIASAFCIALGMSIHVATRGSASPINPPAAINVGKRIGPLPRPVPKAEPAPPEAAESPAPAADEATRDEDPPAANPPEILTAEQIAEQLRFARVLVNYKSKKFHLKSCRLAGVPDGENWMDMPYPDEKAISEKKASACGICKPTVEKASREASELSKPDPAT